jgi:hypothetical protein
MGPEWSGRAIGKEILKQDLHVTDIPCNAVCKKWTEDAFFRQLLKGIE